MIRGIFSRHKNGLVIFVCIFLAVILLAGVFFAHQNRKLESNHNQVTALLSGFTYSELNVESEMASASELLTLSPLSDSDTGKIYKSLAELTYMTGDESKYNQNVANAVFFLKNSREYEEMTGLYIEYIGRLYSNGSYKAAEAFLDDLAELNPIESFQDKSIAAAYYLSYFDVEEMLGNFRSAEFYREKSNEAIANMAGDAGAALQQAKCDMLSARLELLQGNIQGAKDYLSKYSEDDTLGFPKENLYVVCDFLLPYYEISTKIMLSEGNFDQCQRYIDKYIDRCDEYNFRIMKFNLLQAVTAGADGLGAESLNKYIRLEAQTAEEVLSTLAEHYGTAIIANVDTLILQLTDERAAAERRKNVIEGISLFLLFVAAFIIVVYLVVKHLSTDALTGLKSRRGYDRDISALKRRRVSYQLLMLDIDDFKAINDTYGHDTGDRVLVAIAEILADHLNKYINAYRYGGEEFCVTYRGSTKQEMMTLAEEIRRSVEAYGIRANLPVTVSGGLSFSPDGTHPFEAADKALYQAKNKGKNKIIMYDERSRQK